MVILDIGCGRKKISGAIGIDFSSMSDADVVLDLNTGVLPFDDDSVDFIFSSHTLEHLTTEGFMHVMTEAYRVLKPGGQFKLVVPYFSTQANLANPFHNNNVCFNEHTFRFFSSEAETTALAAIEYATPSCPHWGLRYSANSEIGVEFRTIQLKLFYFPQYQDLDDEQKRVARSTKLDVVDQIIYSLVAIKPCPIRPETGPVGSKDDPHPFVAGQVEYLKGQIEWLAGNKVVFSEADKAKVIVDKIVRNGDIYEIDGVMTPVNQLVYELDEVIQRLRRKIDEVAERAREAAKA